jgi:hypothetical protein
MPLTGRPAALQAPWPTAVGAMKGINGAGVGRGTGVFGAGDVEGVVTGLVVVVGGLTRAGVPLPHAAQIRARKSTRADAASRALTEPGAVTLPSTPGLGHKVRDHTRPIRATDCAPQCHSLIVEWAHRSQLVTCPGRDRRPVCSLTARASSTDVSLDPWTGPPSVSLCVLSRGKGGITDSDGGQDGVETLPPMCGPSPGLTQRRIASRPRCRAR